MDFVTEEVDAGKPVDIFFLYFVKTFDKVPRQRLVKKMRANGRFRSDQLQSSKSDSEAMPIHNAVYLYL
jgi:hypothetical protein